MFPLILASTSVTRRRMLADVGIDVQCESPGVDERAMTDVDPARLAMRLARAKADAVARRMPNVWVLGADQVVTDGTSQWGKPNDADDHLRQLQHIRGTSHRLVSGFAIVGPGIEVEGVEETIMHGRADLTDAELAAYVATGEGSYCAGGYAAEARGAFLFERIEGDWFNVLGLPLFPIISALRAHGWRFGATNE